MDYKTILDIEDVDVGALYHDKKLSIDEIDDTVNYWPNRPLKLKGFSANGTSSSALATVKGNSVCLVDDRYRPKGIKPRNMEQTFALSMLADPDIDLVVMTGEAGSGKTLLAVAHALQAASKGSVSKVVLTKTLTPVGREIGYLKGSYMDKMRPWLGNFFDNMEVLGLTEFQIEDIIEGNQERGDGFKIEVSPITFIQGRSIQNAIMVIDEAQNLSKDVVRQILTRAAGKTKVILLGDPAQVFERGVSCEDNGLLWAMEEGRYCEFIAHIHLSSVERSRLAEWAVNAL